MLKPSNSTEKQAPFLEHTFLGAEQNGFLFRGPLSLFIGATLTEGPDQEPEDTADTLCHLPKGRINQDLVPGHCPVADSQKTGRQLWGRNGPLNALCRKPQHLSPWQYSRAGRGNCLVNVCKLLRARTVFVLLSPVSLAPNITPDVQLTLNYLLNEND